MPITGAYGGIIGVDNTPSPSKSITQVNSSGCFCRTATSATVVLVAGGGGGSRGAGGAGGVLVVACHPLPASAVPVTIGAGGATTDAQSPIGNHGNDTVFGSATPLTALKGMAGGGGNAEPISPLSGGVYGSGGGSGGDNPAQGGKGSHPGSYGGCTPTYMGSPGGACAGSSPGGGGGACNLGEGRGGTGGGEMSIGGRGRDLTPLGVPSCIADCGFVGGGGAGENPSDPSNPHSLAIGPIACGDLTDKSSRTWTSARGGGGKGQAGSPAFNCVCCVGTGATDAVANTGGGGGAAEYPGSAPFPAGKRGMAGGSGTVIVIESVVGASANDGIYSIKEHYVAVKSSRW